MLDLIQRIYEADESFRSLDFMVHTRLWKSQVIVQILLGTVTPIALLGLAQFLKLTETVRMRIYALAGCLTVIGIFAMRWNVVIGGQLFSKSFLGYTTYKMAFATREGLLTAIILMLLPFGILWVLVKLLPPWRTRNSPRLRCNSGAWNQLAPSHRATCGASHAASCRQHRLRVRATERSTASSRTPRRRARAGQCVRGAARAAPKNRSSPNSPPPAPSRHLAHIPSVRQTPEPSPSSARQFSESPEPTCCAPSPNPPNVPRLARAVGRDPLRLLLDGLGRPHCLRQPLRQRDLCHHFGADPLSAAVGVHRSLPGPLARVRIRRGCLCRTCSRPCLWRAICNSSLGSPRSRP